MVFVHPKAPFEGPILPAAFVILVVILGVSFAGTYNKLVTKGQDVDRSLLAVAGVVRLPIIPLPPVPPIISAIDCCVAKLATQYMGYSNFIAALEGEVKAAEEEVKQAQRAR